jgi:hypothetical protein
MSQAASIDTTTASETHAQRRQLCELRARIEATLDEMVDLLDRIDRFPDLEGHSTQYLPETGSGPTLVLDPDLKGDDRDLEPSLGNCDGRVSQTRWKDGLADEVELDDADWEPSRVPRRYSPGGSPLVTIPTTTAPPPPRYSGPRAAAETSRTSTTAPSPMWTTIPPLAASTPALGRRTGPIGTTALEGPEEDLEDGHDAEGSPTTLALQTKRWTSASLAPQPITRRLLLGRTRYPTARPHGAVWDWWWGC